MHINGLLERRRRESVLHLKHSGDKLVCFHRNLDGAEKVESGELVFDPRRGWLLGEEPVLLCEVSRRRLEAEKVKLDAFVGGKT